MLIEKKRQGQGKANIIYVKNFVIEDSQNVRKRDSEITKNNIQEVSNWGCNKNKYINIDFNETESNYIVSEKMNWMRREYLIKENIDFDILLERNPYDGEILQGIVDLILEMVLTKTDEVLISNNRYSTVQVK